MSSNNARVQSGSSGTLAQAGTRLLEWNNQRAGEYARARYGGFWGQILILFTEATVERLVKLELSVIDGRDEELMAFKKSLEGELTMIAVAGAILAQIAITALSLPDISQVHWIVRAFFACALVAGILSVHFAVMQQRTLGNLYKAPQIRSWLLANRCAKLLNDLRSLKEMKHKVSFSAAFLVQIPYTMLEYGAAFLILGLGLYLGYAWKNALDTETGKSDNRNVLIVFIAVTGAWLLQWAWAYFGKSIWLESKTSMIDAEKPEQTTLPAMVTRPEVESLDPLRRDPGQGTEALGSRDTTVKALREAAECHRRCANADLVIASLYEVQAVEPVE